MSATDEYSFSNVRSDPLYLEHAIPDASDGAKDFRLSGKFNYLLRSVIDAGNSQSIERHWSEGLRNNELEAAISILEDLRDALWPKLEEGSTADQIKHWEIGRRAFWEHRNPQVAMEQGYHSIQHYYVDTDFLNEATTRYLAHRWLASPGLDALICDALVYVEIRALGWDIKKSMLARVRSGQLISSPGSGVWDGSLDRLSKLAWNSTWSRIGRYLAGYVVLPAIVYGVVQYFIGKHIANLAGGVYLGLVLASIMADRILSWYFPPRSDDTDTQRLTRVYEALCVAYEALGATPCNAGQVRAALYFAQERGAVLSGAVFALVERSIQRDPVIWPTSKF